MPTMKTKERKEFLLETTPNCPRCGCKMIIANPTSQGRSAISHAAVLYYGSLICFGCKRVEDKQVELNRLPFLIRWRIKIDKATDFFTFLRHVKRFINDFIYFKIRGGKPTGRVSHYFR